MIDTEQLFLETVSDLRSQIVTGTPYKLTRASGLLRQLLIDDSTLLSQANRARHVKVRFPVRTLAPLNPHPSTLVMRGFGSPQFGTLIQATLDQFLACHCFAVQGEVFSVQEVIKVTANVRGGIHAGGKVTAKESKLLSVINSGIECEFATGGPVDPALFLIVEIINTTLIALQPLEGAIRQNTQPQQTIR